MGLPSVYCHVVMGRIMGYVCLDEITVMTAFNNVSLL